MKDNIIISSVGAFFGLLLYITIYVYQMSFNQLIDLPFDRAFDSVEQALFQLSLIGLIAITLWLITPSKIRNSILNKFRSNNFGKLSTLAKVSYSSSGFLFLLYFTIARIPLLYQEGGIFEDLTALLAFFSSAILLIVVLRTNQYHKGYLLMLAGALLFFAGEEISWGQRIIGFETPQSLENINYQKETTLHNLFNPLFRPIYFVFNLMMASIILFRNNLTNLLSNYKNLKKLGELLPWPEFIYYGPIFLFLAFLNIYTKTEINEQVWAVFAITYVLALFKRSKKPETTVESIEEPPVEKSTPKPTAEKRPLQKV